MYVQWGGRSGTYYAWKATGRIVLLSLNLLPLFILHTFSVKHRHVYMHMNIYICLRLCVPTSTLVITYDLLLCLHNFPFRLIAKSVASHFFFLRIASHSHLLCVPWKLHQFENLHFTWTQISSFFFNKVWILHSEESQMVISPFHFKKNLCTTNFRIITYAWITTYI